jgi:triosephosphate isomerase (TIM)
MSERRVLIAGNWKMNLAPAEGAALARALVTGLADRDSNADVVLAPTALALPAVVAALGDAPLGVAGQEMRAEEAGAYTGDISGPMLRAAGAGWVILGHSERRQYHAETDAAVALKAKAAIAAGLLPILCVGETLAQREAGEMMDVVLGQVDGVLAGLSEDELSLVTLAYEPVWAIGTGVVASVEQAQEMHGAIRAHLAKGLGGALAGRIRILYGGSVKPDNVRDLLAEPDLDGALVGGASLTADSFLALIPPFPAS